MPNTPNFFANNHLKRTSPGWDCPPVTPSNSADLDEIAKALRVFNTSDEVKEIAFRTPGSGETNRVWKVNPGDTIIPAVVTRVMDTGTDSADLEIHAIVD